MFPLPRSPITEWIFSPSRRRHPVQGSEAGYDGDKEPTLVNQPFDELSPVVSRLPKSFKVRSTRSTVSFFGKRIRLVIQSEKKRSAIGEPAVRGRKEQHAVGRLHRLVHRELPDRFAGFLFLGDLFDRPLLEASIQFVARLLSEAWEITPPIEWPTNHHALPLAGRTLLPREGIGLPHLLPEARRAESQLLPVG